MNGKIVKPESNVLVGGGGSGVERQMSTPKYNPDARPELRLIYITMPPSTANTWPVI